MHCCEYFWVVQCTVLLHLIYLSFSHSLSLCGVCEGDNKTTCWSAITFKPQTFFTAQVIIKQQCLPCHFQYYEKKAAKKAFTIILKPNKPQEGWSGVSQRRRGNTSHICCVTSLWMTCIQKRCTLNSKHSSDCTKFVQQTNVTYFYYSLRTRCAVSACSLTVRN